MSIKASPTRTRCAARIAVAPLFVVLASVLPLAPAVLAQGQGAAVAAAAPADQSARYDAARDAYEIGHFHIAFAAFAQLADEGHCDAARVAREMVRYGRELYATEFVAAAARLARWRDLQGCPAALARR